MELGVAQAGSAPSLDDGGRWFESSHPDQHVLRSSCRGRAVCFESCTHGSGEAHWLPKWPW